MNDGLQEKFFVSRVDGKDQPGGSKDNARYFVLDYVNDPMARYALGYYIYACQAKYPELAADLKAALEETRSGTTSV